LALPSWLYAKEKLPSLALAKHFTNEMNAPYYWVSEKLDGIRCYWSGKQLLTRNGNIIHAPDWFTKSFPSQALDGELWIGRESYQELMRTVMDHKPDHSLWQKVSYRVFDLPSSNLPFEQRQKSLVKLLPTAKNSHIKLVDQKKMGSLDKINRLLKDKIAAGAEGLMLRTPESPYTIGRSQHLLKLKLRQDTEARVVAYQQGRGKYSNMMGAIWVEMENGQLFKIGTGFSDAERRSPPLIGSDITFSYQGFTEKGLPRFASFERERKPE